MQTWEYIDVAISRVKNKWIVDGKEVAEADATRTAILNKYGAEGWELVSVSTWQGEMGAGHTYYFKRPVNANSQA
jgi:hypothetical protein